MPKLAEFEQNQYDSQSQMTGRIQAAFDTYRRFGKKPIREKINHPAFHDLFNSALDSYDPSERKFDFTFWVTSVTYDRPTDTWIHNSESQPPGAIRPFAGLAGKIYCGEVELVGKRSVLPADLQEKIKAKFPQNFQPFEEVDYRLHPVRRWIEHPGFHNDLRQALSDINQEREGRKSFVAWLTGVDSDDGNKWEVKEARSGRWKSFDQFSRVYALSFVGDSSPLPLDIQELIKQNFPAEFLPFEDVPYQLHPIKRWMGHPTFQNELRQALQAYEPENGKMAFFTFLSKVGFNEQKQKWVIGEAKTGRWVDLAKTIRKEMPLVGIASPLPDDIQALIRQKFLDIAVPYTKLKAIEWLDKPDFHKELSEALDHLPESSGVSLKHWLKTVDHLKENYERVSAKERGRFGPWKRLARYCETHKVKRGVDWHTIFVGDTSPLPSYIQEKIIEKFPQDFRDALAVNYRLVKANEWFNHPQFLSELATVLEQYQGPLGINFRHWIKFVKPQKPHLDKIEGWVKGGFGPWNRLLHYLKMYFPDGKYASLFEKHDISPYIQDLLKRAFPKDFLTPEEMESVQYDSAPARIERLTEALKEAGFNISSAPLVSHHLVGKYPTDVTDALQYELYEEAIVNGKHNGKAKSVRDIRHFIHTVRIISNTLERQSQSKDSVLKEFADVVLARLIREKLYTRINHSLGIITPEMIQSLLSEVKDDLHEVIAQDMQDYVEKQVDLAGENLVTAVKETEHLQNFFTHPLSLEQRWSIYSLATQDGKHLLAHAPGEGKTAIALAGTWDYLRRREQLNNAVILFLGTKAAVDNLQRNQKVKLNNEFNNQLEVADWMIKDAIDDRYEVLRESLGKEHKGPILLPVSYSMMEGHYINDFNALLHKLRVSQRPVVVIGDEFHHCLGRYTVVTKPGLQETSLIPISGLSDEGKLVAVAKVQSFYPIDNLIRVAGKAILITGTPLNTDVTQLVHLASILESQPSDNAIIYPSYERVKGWIEDPAALSTALHNKMFRSSHLSLPDVQRITLSCDFNSLSETSRDEILQAVQQGKTDKRHWQMAAEMKAVMPYITPLLAKSTDFPVVVSVPYVDEQKFTGHASVKHIVNYLRNLGFLNTAGLDSQVKPEKANRILNKFKEEDGVDIVVFSPAFAESRDFQGKRPISLVINIGASTVRGYEQALRRVVRPGNKAEAVYVVSPIPVNMPHDDILLKRRYNNLFQRSETAAAILDPVTFITETIVVTPDVLEKFLFNGEVESRAKSAPSKEDYTYHPSLMDLLIREEETTPAKDNKTLQYVGEMKDEIGVALRKEGKENGMARIEDLQNKITRFILMETELIAQQLSNLDSGNSVSKYYIRESVINGFNNFTKQNEDDNYDDVVGPVFDFIRSNTIDTEVTLPNQDISDLTLVIALRQRDNPHLQNVALHQLQKRYSKYIKSILSRNSRQAIEDVEQEIWLWLIKSSFLPFGTLSSPIRRISKQKISIILNGTYSVQSDAFSDLEYEGEDEDQRSPEERGILYTYLEQ